VWKFVTVLQLHLLAVVAIQYSGLLTEVAVELVVVQAVYDVWKVVVELQLHWLVAVVIPVVE
jgi:hypothetical protein